jgi:hypothetical protein
VSVARKAVLPPGHFLPTIARHRRFLGGLPPDAEVRFVTPDLVEWHPISTYLVEGIVYVDLERVNYEPDGKPA